MAPIPSLSERIGGDRLQNLIDRYATSDKVGRDDAIENILATHLADLVSRGVARPLEALANRRVHLASIWDHMCGRNVPSYTTQEQERVQIARRLCSPLITGPLYMLGQDVTRGISAQDRRSKLQTIVANMDRGSVGYWWFGDERDHVSGEKFQFELRDWNLVFGRRPARGQQLEEVEDLPPAGLHAVEIDVPTGDLLVADWFRVEGFTELVDEGDPWRGGSQAENERDAERYAREYGFISVASALRSLSILTNGNQIAIGHHDEDGPHPLPAGYQSFAHHTIDLRKVSVVDRSLLTVILTRIHAPKRAAKLCEEFAAGADTRRLTIAPGRYRVTSSGRGVFTELLPDGHPLKTTGFDTVLLIEPA